MRENKIVNIGSSNTDMVVKTNKIPVPGETVLGGEFFMNPSGKGANQAVAVARLGGSTLVRRLLIGMFVLFVVGLGLIIRAGM